MTNFPKPLVYDSKAVKPALVEFFQVGSHKMLEKIIFDDILFCEKRAVVEPSGFWVIKRKGVYKIGAVTQVGTDGSFTLQSGHNDKGLFPDYSFTPDSIEDAYRILTVCRDLQETKTERTEDWDNYNEVDLWTPKSFCDNLHFDNSIKSYLQKEYPIQLK